VCETSGGRRNPPTFCGFSVNPLLSFQKPGLPYFPVCSLTIARGWGFTPPQIASTPPRLQCLVGTAFRIFFGRGSAFPPCSGHCNFALPWHFFILIFYLFPLFAISWRCRVFFALECSVFQVTVLQTGTSFVPWAPAADSDVDFRLVLRRSTFL